MKVCERLVACSIFTAEQWQAHKLTFLALEAFSAVAMPLRFKSLPISSRGLFRTVDICCRERHPSLARADRPSIGFGVPLKSHRTAHTGS